MLCSIWERQEKENVRHNSEDTSFSEEEGREGAPDAGTDSFPAHGEDHGGASCLSIVHGVSQWSKYLLAAHGGPHGFLAGPVNQWGTLAGAVH